MPVTTVSLLPDLLIPVYGPDPSAQVARYAAALDHFHRVYGPGPVTLLRAPGRVNLIGEHTDYNGGYVLPAALDKDILLLARPRADAVVQAVNLEVDYPATTFALSTHIEPAPNGHWSNYLRGAAQMATRQVADAIGQEPLGRGLDLLIAAAPPQGVPRGSGLSSSSALVVVVALAFAHFSQRSLDPMPFAQACADAEWYVGTRGGIMDHFAAILTQRDHALFLDCRAQADGSYPTRHIPFPAAYRLLVIESGVHHQNVRGEYNRRVAACRAGVALLRREHPGITQLRDVETIPWAKLAPFLPEQTTIADLAATGIDLGELPGVDPYAPLRVQACCRHVWHENHRVLETLNALDRNDVAAVGDLLTAAHRSARDDYNISTPELDFLVETACAVEGVAGARLTGAGWGGCVLALVHTDAVPLLQKRLAAAFAAQFGRVPAMFLCQAGPGAGLVATLEL